MHIGGQVQIWALLHSVVADLPEAQTQGADRVPHSDHSPHVALRADTDGHSPAPADAIQGLPVTGMPQPEPVGMGSHGAPVQDNGMFAPGTAAKGIPDYSPNTSTPSGSIRTGSPSWSPMPGYNESGGSMTMAKGGGWCSLEIGSRLTVRDRIEAFVLVGAALSVP